MKRICVFVFLFSMSVNGFSQMLNEIAAQSNPHLFAQLFLEQNLLSISEKDSIEISKAGFEFPKFAKHKMIEHVVKLNVLFDENNQISDIRTIQLPYENIIVRSNYFSRMYQQIKFDRIELPYSFNKNYTIFDTTSYNNLLKLKRVKFEKVKPNQWYILCLNYDFSINQSFDMVYCNLTFICYNESEKLAFYSKRIDSTNTFHSLFIDTSKGQVSNRIIHKLDKVTPTYSSYAEESGTIRFGFEVDTNGIVSNKNIIRNISISIDKEANKDFNEMKGIWIPAREDGIKINSYNEFDISYDEYGTLMINSPGYNKKNSIASFERGTECFENEKFEKALKHYLIAKKYFVDDIELLYKIVLTEIRLEKYDDACKDLEEIKRVAIDKPFPTCVSEAKVDELIKLGCSKTQE